MTTPVAPAASALRVLRAKVQASGNPAGVPRDTSAIDPAGKPAQSAVLQPRASPEGCATGAVTSLLPE